MSRIPIGKLPNALLERLLARYTHGDPRVLVGAAVGEDAAIIDMGDRCLVAKTDPVTFATDDIGYYAVHVNANDIACCGATPKWFLATLLLPERDTTAALAEAIFAQLAEACTELSVTLCGGHTEITHGLERPIVIGQMLGEVEHGHYVTSAGARVGDALILTKGIAVEATAVICRERKESLRGVLGPDAIARGAAFLRRPGISVVADARLAAAVGGVHALHDPTEGGLATGLLELAQAAGVGLLVEEAAVPVLPECATLCRHFDLDPLGLIASGALLIAAAHTQAQAMVEHLSAHGVAASVIGRVRPASGGLRLRRASGDTVALPRFARDEITRLFE
ncbi:MAG: hydrogenase expression protein [Gammaproteobacteria bacterium]|nr:hydrogenase expression protein [Gammaproteobacteria bacterium]